MPDQYGAHLRLFGVCSLSAQNRIPLQLAASGDAQSGLGTSLQSYEKHLPRALTTMPVGPFEASIEVLHSAEELMTPVRSFIAALVEGSVASLRRCSECLLLFTTGR